MSITSIVFADLDEKYLAPLVSKFLDEFADSADIVLITDKAYLKEYFSEQRSLDILVIHEDLYSSELEKHNISYTIVLSEDNAPAKGERQSNRVYKYTSVKEVFNQILTQIPSLVLQNTETKTIMVYSPAGGSGTTFVAVGLAAALAKAKRRVFFISTSPLQSFTYFVRNVDFMQEFAEDKLKIRDSSIMQALETMTGFEVFDLLLPFRQATSALGLTNEDFSFVIDAIKREKKYDYIVIDSSSELTTEKTLMMSQCDRTVIVTGQASSETAKFALLLSNINISDANRFVIICNRYDPASPNWLLRSESMDRVAVDDYIPLMDFAGKIPDPELLSSQASFQKLAYLFM